MLNKRSVIWFCGHTILPKKDKNNAICNLSESRFKYGSDRDGIADIVAGMVDKHGYRIWPTELTE